MGYKWSMRGPHGRLDLNGKTTMRLTSSIALILAAVACQLGCAPRDPVALLAPPTIAPNPNGAAPLAAVVRVRAADAAWARLDVFQGADQWSLPCAAADLARGLLPVTRLRADEPHRIRVVLGGRLGKIIASAPLAYRPPKTPGDPTEFPRITVAVADADRLEPGLTLFNPRRRMTGAAMRTNDEFGMLAAVDNQGHVVWTYRCNSRISDFRRLRNDHLVVITQDYRLIEIDLLGNIHRQWVAAGRPQGPAADAIPVETTTFHHSVKELPNGNFLILGSTRRQIPDYYTSEDDANAPRKTQWVMGDEILEFRPDDGHVVWRWDAFDHLDPMRIGYQTFSRYWGRRGFPGTVDWSHANNITLSPDGRTILCNSRTLSAIIAINRSDGEIQWIAGEPTGWSRQLQPKLLSLADADERWFWHQHAPEWTDRGTLMLFNNDNYRARPFTPGAPPSAIRSHAAEYELDLADGTIRRVWTSLIPGVRPPATWAMGSAQPLKTTGNVLAGYGLAFRLEDLAQATWATRMEYLSETEVIEFSRTDPPEILWRMTLTGQAPHVGWSLFGARRVPSLRMTP